ncbi:MAG: sensor histidine kinase [Chlamydiales bacterium]
MMYNAPREIIAGITMILAAILPLLLCIKNTNHLFLWFIGFLSVVITGTTFIVLGSYIAKTPHVFIWSKNQTMAFPTAILLMIFALGILLFVGVRLKQIYVKGFPIWSAILVGLLSFWGVISAWLPFVARENSLVLNELTKRVSIVQENLTMRMNLYFDVLFRLRERIEELSLTPNFYAIQEKDVQHLLNAFSSLMGVIVVSEDKVLFEKVRGDDNTIVSNNPLLMEIVRSEETTPQTNSLEIDSLSYYVEREGEEEAFQGKFVKLNGIPLMISRIPLSIQGTKATLIIVNDAKKVFANVISQIIQQTSAIEIVYNGITLFSHGNDNWDFKEKYLVSKEWDFFGVTLQIILWPLNNSLFELQSNAGYYLVLGGAIFSILLGLCVYLIQLYRKKQREAEENVIEKTFFFANMSHELRTPLHGIVGSCSILEMTDLDQNQRKWVAIVEDSSKVLLSLINELLYLSKLELEEDKQRIIAVNLRQVGTDVVDLYQEKAQEKGLFLVFAYDENLPTHFLLDPLGIKQVIANVLRNAIKYTQNGSIHLGFKGKKHTESQYEVTLTITDTGSGISEKEREIMFDKYKHIDVRSEKGGSLGLIITRKIVDLMGGDIHVGSTQDSGTTLQIVFIAKEAKLEKIDSI